jgi:hypothetical protein
MLAANLFLPLAHSLSVWEMQYQLTNQLQHLLVKLGVSPQDAIGRDPPSPY